MALAALTLAALTLGARTAPASGSRARAANVQSERVRTDDVRGTQRRAALSNGAACMRGSECRSGVCEGPGCGPGGGRCVAANRMCSRDRSPFCGCDGRVFYASGGCPGARYRHAGLCSPLVSASGRAVTVTGALDATVVRRIVRRNAAQLSYCHERAVSTQPDAHGHFVLRIVVGDDGGVQSTSVASGTASPPSLGQCAASAARRWQFPRPSDGATATVSIAVAFDEVRGARVGP